GHGSVRARAAGEVTAPVKIYERGDLGLRVGALRAQPFSRNSAEKAVFDPHARQRPSERNVHCFAHGGDVAGTRQPRLECVPQQEAYDSGLPAHDATPPDGMKMVMRNGERTGGETRRAYASAVGIRARRVRERLR